MKWLNRGTRRAWGLAAFALAAIGLSACSTLREGSPDATRPAVSINDRNEIVVNQEPILVDSRSPKPIVFELPKDGGLRFAGAGIVIEGEVIGIEPVTAADNNVYRRTEAPRDGKPSAYVTLLNKGQQTVQCKTESEVRVVCAVLNPRPGSVFIYTVRILKGGVVYTLDPSIRTM